jgi:hypothetical protein
MSAKSDANATKGKNPTRIRSNSNSDQKDQGSGSSSPSVNSMQTSSDGSSSSNSGSNEQMGFTQTQLDQMREMMGLMINKALAGVFPPQTQATPPHGSYAAAVGSGTTSTSGSSSSTSHQPAIPRQTATVVNSSVGLFGNQDKVSASLPALKPLPKTADYDAFEEWKKIAINDMINTGGMDHIVTKTHDESLKLAIELDSGGRSNHAVETLWKNFHLKACSVLKSAFRAALKDTPETEAELEQQRNPDDFIKGNANWLWQFAVKQFVPDPIGRITKALKSLETIQFIPKKSTPSDYHTSFREAINEIRSADPYQQFTDKFLLAAYLKGWPADLNQQRNMVHTNPNPTVEDAQRLLQQWYNDNGKKKPAVTAPPNSESTPPAPATATQLAALKQARDKLQAEWKKADSKFRKANKRGDKDQNPREENSDSKHSLGALKEVPLNSTNRFAALSDSKDSESEHLNAVSEDGLETVNTRNEFLLDSGASRSVVCDYKLLRDPQPLKQPVKLNCAMGKATILTESGQVQLNSRVKLGNVCYAKGATLNAMSVSKIADTGYYSVFGSAKAIVVKKTALDYALKKLKPADIALEVPRVGDIYTYTRPGTGPVKDISTPALEVKAPPNSIPKVGEKAQSKRGTQPDAGQSSAPSGSSSPSASSSSTSSAPRNTRSKQVSPSLANAVSAALVATLAAHGLPPDTELDVATWYSLTHKEDKCL